MKKLLRLIPLIILNLILFIGAFIGSAYLVNKLLNSGMDNLAREQKGATIPVCYSLYEDTIYNPMSGFKQAIRPTLDRQNVIPLNDNNGAEVIVSVDESYIESCEYELRSVDSNILIEEGEAVKGEDYGGFARYGATFRMDIDEGSEYIFVFKITNKSGEVLRYYTRVAVLDNPKLGDFIGLSKTYHNETFIKEKPEDGNTLTSYLTKASLKDESLDISHVTFDSSYRNLTYGDLQVEAIGEIIPVVQEIDDNFAVIKYEYTLKNIPTEEEDVPRFSGTGEHYYNVRELYTMYLDPKTGEIKIISYDRTMDSQFDTSMIFKGYNSVGMGITSEDIDYVESEDSKVLAFVRQGELWLYDYPKSNIVSVFSFSGGNVNDPRTRSGINDIRVLSVDDDGNICFVVYGYMSRGDHEGENGISLCAYDNETRKVDELVFVTTDEPYSVMKNETGQFVYYNQDSETFYYLLNGYVYKCDLKTGENETYTNQFKQTDILVSGNGSALVYPNSMSKANVTSLSVDNFGSETTRDITGSDSDRFCAIGYVGADFIYGVAHASDVTVATSGAVNMAFYKLCIESPEGEILKEYQPNGRLVTNVVIESDKIRMTLSSYESGTLQEVDEDYIAYKQESYQKKTKLVQDVDEAESTVCMLKMIDEVYMNITPSYVITKTTGTDDLLTLNIQSTPLENVFHVFDANGYVSSYDSAGIAIAAIIGEDNAKSRASSAMVVDVDGNVIYRDLLSSSYNTVASKVDETSCDSVAASFMTCAYMCLEYMGARPDLGVVLGYSDWEEVFKKNSYGLGIDISGVSLETAIYFLDKDIPFVVKIDDGRYVLVISYNGTHIRYYDPVKNEEVKVLRRDFKNSMSLQGDKMYTFIK